MTFSPSAATPATIDGLEFQKMLGDFVRAEPGVNSDEAYQKLVLFIDAHADKHRKEVNSLTMNARQLRAAAELANPDGEADPCQLDTVVTLTAREAFVGHTEDGGDIPCPAGLYLTYDDMPEEGVILLPAEDEQDDSPNEELATLSETSTSELKNKCPVCGASGGQECSMPDPADPLLGIELGNQVHAARLKWR
jgi:hypothetical protein